MARAQGLMSPSGVAMPKTQFIRRGQGVRRGGRDAFGNALLDRFARPHMSPSIGSNREPPVAPVARMSCLTEGETLPIDTRAEKAAHVSPRCGKEDASKVPRGQ